MRISRQMSLLILIIVGLGQSSAGSLENVFIEYQGLYYKNRIGCEDAIERLNRILNDDEWIEVKNFDGQCLRNHHNNWAAYTSFQSNFAPDFVTISPSADGSNEEKLRYTQFLGDLLSKNLKIKVIEIGKDYKYLNVRLKVLIPYYLSGLDFDSRIVQKRIPGRSLNKKECDERNKGWMKGLSVEHRVFGGFCQKVNKNNYSGVVVFFRKS